MAEGAYTIQVADKQPWVKRLRGYDKEVYEEVRQESIDEMTEDYTERLHTFLGKVAELGADVAVAEGALAIATGMRNGFEAGIQVGMDSVQTANIARNDERASVLLNFIGNPAG